MNKTYETMISVEVDKHNYKSFTGLADDVEILYWGVNKPLPVLPASLKILTYTGKKPLPKILPPGLIIIHAAEIESLEGVILPDSLEELICVNAVILPSRLSANLKKLVSWRAKLIPPLPESIIEIDCPAALVIPPLPPKVETIICFGAHQLPIEIPASVNSIHCHKRHLSQLLMVMQREMEKPEGSIGIYRDDDEVDTIHLYTHTQEDDGLDDATMWERIMEDDRPIMDEDVSGLTRQ